ncbi:LysM peptidoglycan-binding domain-containing protein [Ochrovirga pacifica]|uniref:LysM peptidoglycan-binding domain-containing protein n=1 Tax=Ochrovirga pacifica TaxID=1042376 RepID=UPI0002559818|nr:LysM peptidoglycan-binding domain-containing protein [Ochrovirga pacifica]
MKESKLLFFLFFAIITTSLVAQKTKDYKTQKGETLKEIAEKFKVNYKALLKANPDVKEKPKKNTILKIPFKLTPTLNSRDLQPIDFREDKENRLSELPREKTYGLHEVKPKETLYSLSKQYGISMSNLIQLNPVLAKDGLKIGQVLKVPKKQEVHQPEVKRVVVKKQHLVQPKETLYGISKMYSVSIDAIKNNNPTIEIEGLKIGTTLIIPVREVFVTETQLKTQTKVRKKIKISGEKHIVTKGETLYSIAKQHGVAISELLRANDSIVLDSLVVGTALDLPYHKVSSVYMQSSIAPMYKAKPVKYFYRPKQDSIYNILQDYRVSMDSLSSINPNLDSILFYGGDLLLGFDKEFYLFDEHQKLKDSIVTNRSLSLMLMLPFQLKQNDTLKENDLFSSPNSLPNIVSDFYMGAELAIDSLRKQGVKLKVDVIDTEKSVNAIHSKIDSLKALNPNVIVGPLYSGNAMFVATNFPSTPVYYPVYSSKQSGFTNFNLIKTAASKDLLKDQMLSFIKDHRKDEHLIIVGKQEHINTLKSYQKALIKKDSLGMNLQEDITLLTLSSRGYFTPDDFSTRVKPNKTNWILIAENNNVITNDVFSNVSGLAKDEELNVDFRILSFEKLNFVNKLSYVDLAKQQYTYATDEVEYEPLLASTFENQYLKKNNALPSEFAVRGFSVTYDAVIRVLLRKQHDVSGASHRYKQAFYYHKNGFPINGNQTVFINTVENTKENGLRIVRLK